MKRIIAFFMMFSIFMLGTVTCFAETEEKKEDESIEKAKSAILMCMDTGDIIYEKNAYEHCSPASVTKVMSILLILEAIDSGKISLTDSVAASRRARLSAVRTSPHRKMLLLWAALRSGLRLEKK